MEAHAADPGRPDYDAADYLGGAYAEKGGIDPKLRAHAARVMKDDAEVRKQLGKVRVLKGAARTAPKAPAKP